MTTDGNPAEGQVPEKSETDKLIEALTAKVDAHFASYTSKINGELAALRRKGKEETQPGQAPATVSIEDLRASREIGRLESAIGDDAIRALGEEYESMPPAHQLTLLRAVATLTKKRESGAMPVSTTPNARAAVPAPREAVSRPRTQFEFARLRKDNPSAYRELVADPSFDPGALPLK